MFDKKNQFWNNLQIFFAENSVTFHLFLLFKYVIEISLTIEVHKIHIKELDIEIVKIDSNFIVVI